MTISLFVHATEDKDLLIRLLGENLGVQEEEIAIGKMQGYFGNEILSAKAHLIGGRATAVGNQIFSLLSKTARGLLLLELDKSMDEHDSIYLHVDRQTLQTGKIELSDEEPIRIKLKPRARSGGREFMKKQYMDLIQ